MPAAISVSVRTEDFDLAAEVARIRREAPGAGAIVTFTGVCRGEDGRLKALELEHYPDMAEAEIGRIAAEAAARWPVGAIAVVHRHGVIPAGENIVLVVAASPHRDAAFAAAGFLMDFLKTSAPFWKKEHLADGSEGPWVSAHASDDAAADRWRR
jgi:molybdopterin synthase catalytic subunit